MKLRNWGDVSFLERDRGEKHNRPHGRGLQEKGEERKKEAALATQEGFQ